MINELIHALDGVAHIISVHRDFTNDANNTEKTLDAYI